MIKTDIDDKVKHRLPIIFNGNFQIFVAILFVYITILICLYTAYSQRYINISNPTVIGHHVVTEPFVIKPNEIYFIHKLYIELKYSHQNKPYIYDMYIGMNTFDEDTEHTRQQLIKDTILNNPSRCAIGSTSSKNKFWIQISNPSEVSEDGGFDTEDSVVIFILTTMACFCGQFVNLGVWWCKKTEIKRIEEIELKNLKKV